MTRNEAIESLRQLYSDANAENKAALECLIPELKESEDEKRVKAIEVLEQQRHFWSYDGPADKTPPATKRKDLVDAIDVALSYLEKQKEQKPYEPKNWPVDKDNLTQEQKPLDWSEDFEENIRTLLHNKLTWHSEDGSMSSTVFIDDKTLKDIVSGIWFYVGKEALKYPNKEIHVPEWSEEDEDYYDAIIAKLEVTQDDAMLTDNQIDFLKSLPEKFILQPKQEWSEEDEKMLRTIISDGVRGVGLDNSQVDWLKSLRPQPHWKPSEEQMKHLERCFSHGHTSQLPNQHVLESLYNDLKKL